MYIVYDFLLYNKTEDVSKPIPKSLLYVVVCLTEIRGDAPGFLCCLNDLSNLSLAGVPGQLQSCLALGRDLVQPEL